MRLDHVSGELSCGSRYGSSVTESVAGSDPTAAAEGRTLRVAFVVGIFPVVSETFVIDQVAELLERGVAVEIFSFNRGDQENVSRRYFEHDMAARTTYLDYPLGWGRRFVHAWPRIIRLARARPALLRRILNPLRYGRWALSLKLLYWAEPFSGRDFDVVHCHFGTVARDFVPVHDALGLNAPLVTTFYGIDVSKVFREESPRFYDELKRACSRYFVMSEDMKRRVVASGFPPEQVHVHPVSVAVEGYPFKIRTLADGDELRLMAVGRFVEKKGFDDLLRALAIVKERASRPVSCVIVGGGPLEPELHELSVSLGLDDVVRFAGLRPVEEVVQLFTDMHLLVQPSKTAADGDME